MEYLVMATLREKESKIRVVNTMVNSGSRNITSSLGGALTLGITINKNGSSNIIGPATNPRNPLRMAANIPSWRETYATYAKQQIADVMVIGNIGPRFPVEFVYLARS